MYTDVGWYHTGQIGFRLLGILGRGSTPGVHVFPGPQVQSLPILPPPPLPHKTKIYIYFSSFFVLSVKTCVIVTLSRKGAV